MTTSSSVAGVLTPDATRRAAIVAPPAERATRHPADHAHVPGSPARMSSAWLLKSVVDIDIEYCPNCGRTWEIVYFHCVVIDRVFAVGGDAPVHFDADQQQTPQLF